MDFHGLIVSPGVALGPIFHYAGFDEQSCLEQLAQQSAHTPPQEQFSAAVTEVRNALRRKRASLQGAQAEILEAHIEIAEDETLCEDVLLALEDGLPLGEAITQTFAQYSALFARSTQQRIRERVADLTEVRNYLLCTLAGLPQQDLSHLPHPCIIVAHDLLPGDTLTLDRANALGIVTEIGGETSHTSIIARSYGIPCLVGVAGICAAAGEGEIVLLDAENGRLILSPDTAQQKEAEDRRGQYLAQREQTLLYRTAEGKTPDGTRVEVCINLAAITSEAMSAAEYADGVGLLRTEFLYMGRAQLPTEEEQTEQYRAVLRRFGQKPVVLRTLDIGGDKKAECLPLPQEQNPFLGERALRFCFAHPEIFRTQLRAALRASTAGNLWVMFPMVGSVEDFLRARDILLEEKESLLRQGVPVAEHIKIGAMIEIPSMALAAGALAAVADFASIGSNDLTQYLLAVDRTEPAVSAYCQKYHPAVLTAIRMAAQAFTAAGKPISICGELGGDPLAIPALLGSGIGKLSMSDGLVAAAKETIAHSPMVLCRQLLSQCCQAATAGEVHQLLTQFAAQQKGVTP